ncbi:MAG: epoxyqueuosine reductase QueH [Clostridia bacterium]|nr:epoxyqueuosine reductase QueH [Clostridia bacterium]
MKLLLHVCCGPCLAAFDEYFKQKGIQYSGYFYNPNIHPYLENTRRMRTFMEYAAGLGLETIVDPQFDLATWENKLGSLSDSERCAYCYKRRIEACAKTAAANGFTHFTTTLLISPYQDHDMLRETGMRAGEKFRVEFYYHDFRELYRHGQDIAREAGIYRQKYCGCIYSYNDSRFREKIKWD